MIAGSSQNKNAAYHPIKTEAKLTHAQFYIREYLRIYQ